MKTPLRLEPVIDTVYKIIPNFPINRIPENADKTALQELLIANVAHLNAREVLIDLLVGEGQIGEACQLRLDGCMLVSDLLDLRDGDDEIVLEWDDSFTARSLTMVFDSATDHFIIGDFEMSAAMLELLVDHDVEDHLNAASLLAFCYVALEEWELFEEIQQITSPDDLSSQLAEYWASFRRGDSSEATNIRNAMQSENPALYEELTASEHEISQEYLADIDSNRPTAGAKARQIWLQTEPIWRSFPEFITLLNAPKS